MEIFQIERFVKKKLLLYYFIIYLFNIIIKKRTELYYGDIMAMGWYSTREKGSAFLNSPLLIRLLGFDNDDLASNLVFNFVE